MENQREDGLTFPKAQLPNISVPCVLGNSNSSAGLGEGYDYWVLGPFGIVVCRDYMSYCGY